MCKYINIDEIPPLLNEEYKRTKKLIDQGETHLDNLAEGFLEAAQVITRIPPTNAVEVVRCNDCKHYEYDDENGGLCYFHDEYFDGTDFCSYGELKEN